MWLLLLLTPWPGDGHPGGMTLEEKGAAREDAAERARGRSPPLACREEVTSLDRRATVRVVVGLSALTRVALGVVPP